MIRSRGMNPVLATDGIIARSAAKQSPNITGMRPRYRMSPMRRMQPITRQRFDAILFDLDGVLTSTAAIHARAWKQMFDHFLREYAPHHRPFDINSDYKRFVDGRPRYEGVRS